MNIPLTTPVLIKKSTSLVSYHNPILLLGSCFSQNIGEKLNASKFTTNTNPFGIIYNPISITNAVKRIIKKSLYSLNELHEFNEKWVSFDHHGEFSSFSKTTCLEKINSSIIQANQQLSTTNILFITLGSAWVYRHIKTNKIVANCHKIPAKEFTKELLNVDEIVANFNTIAKELKNTTIVFTISPIRHIKDGLQENNWSKSTLHLAVKTIVEKNKNCAYFPAYELVMDELRDYRFFKNDLIHPTELAIDYVWKKFVTCFMGEKDLHLMSEIEKIQTAVNHRPFNNKSSEHQKFIAVQLAKMDQLTANYPFLNFSKERELINLATR